MTDRELLELAAKAAGYKLKEGWVNSYGEHLYKDQLYISGTSTPWMPFDVENQAFRLMIQLGLKVKYHDVLGQCLVWVPGSREFEDIRVNVEDCGGDRYAAVRRGVVLAAAEMGRML